MNYLPAAVLHHASLCKSVQWPGWHFPLVVFCYGIIDPGFIVFRDLETAGMIPTVWEDEEEHPTVHQIFHGMHQPVAPADPPKKVEKPLPTFHNRPRTYAKNLKDWEES